MLDPKPPYILFEDNGDETTRLTMHLGGMSDIPEEIEWPQQFIFPMSFQGLTDNFIPQDKSEEMQQEFLDKVVHIPTGVDEG